MNQDQMISLVRQVLLAAGGGLVTHGYFSGDQWGVIVTGIATLIVTSGWAIYSRRENGLIASAAAQPSVKSIVATSAVAAAVPSAKVTS